jgi:transketolase
MEKFKYLGEKPTRQGFGEALVELGRVNGNVVVLGADVTGSVKTSLFAEEFPERFFNIGIAEQNATTIAAGLALSGKIPFFSSYSAFAAFRNADQLRVSVAYNNVNVKIGGGHSGITVGQDGATHQSLEELAMLRTLPNMTVVCPCDYEETKKATIAIAEMIGPAFIRFGRTAVPQFTDSETPFTLGKAEIFREGTDVTVIACGIMVWEALEAAEKLSKQNISVRVINNHTIKPIDEKTIVDAALETGAVVTAEEHQVHGGMGSAVAEVLAKNFPVPIEFVGMKDEFGMSGDPKELTEHYGFTWKEIYASVFEVLDRKKNGYKKLRKVKEVAQYKK